MILTIDTDKRDELGISTDAYLLLDLIWKARSHDRDLLANFTLWSRSKIGAAINELEAAGLFTEATGEFSDEWMSMFDPTIKVDLSGLKSLTDTLIEHLSQRTGRKFRNTRGFQKNIQRLVKAAPKYSSELQFKALIDWMITWPEPYKSHVEPDWFKCKHEKFITFCERANEYWRTKNKGA